MFRSSTAALRPVAFASLALALVSTAALPQTERRSRIRVDHYTIDAEIQPATQALIATAEVRFVPLDNNTSSATFELNNALNVSKVVDGKGATIQDTRNTQNFTEKLAFDPPLAKGQPAIAKFIYEGRLSGSEDSPVYGIKFAAIHPDYAFLLYPARWFPISGYTTDRFTADMHITVPNGYQVLGSGIDSHQAAGDKMVYSFSFTEPSFPGSIAVVKDAPTKVSSEGVTSNMFFRGDEKTMEHAYGEQIGQMLSYFTGIFGLPPNATLNVVEMNARLSQRLLRARYHLPESACHRQAGRRQIAGQSGLPPVVGRSGLARHAQSSLADQRLRRLLRTALDRAHRRAGRARIAIPRRRHRGPHGG